MEVYVESAKMGLVSYRLVLCVTCFTITQIACRQLLPADNTIPVVAPTVVHKWVTIDYVIPNNMSYHNFRMTYPYDYRNIILGGIQVYKGEIYVTIPRLSPGVTATLNRVVEKDGETRLEPFPNWEWQTIGDCDALQAVNNIELDPEKGWMWIIDTGRVNTFWGGVKNLCQPKLIIYDLNKHEVVTRYVFPSDVASINDSFLSNIAIDPEAGYAFIPDTVRAKLIFFSLNDNFSITVDHPLFKYEKGNNSITVNGRRMVLSAVSAHIWGIAMSPRRDYILYSHLGGYGIYRISTEFFRILVKNPDHVTDVGNYIKRVGYKSAQSASLFMGQNNLYYGALGKQAVYDCEVNDLLSYPDVSEDTFGQVPQSKLVADERMYWINSITLDTEGVMWITSSNLVRYFLDVMDYHDTFNYFIWKIYVGEKSYLQKKTSPLQTTTTAQPTTTTTTAVLTNNDPSVHDGSRNMASWNQVSATLMALRLAHAVASLTVS